MTELCVGTHLQILLWPPSFSLSFKGLRRIATVVDVSCVGREGVTRGISF